MNGAAPQPAPRTPTVARRSWEEVVAGNDSLFFLPESLEERAKEWAKKRTELFVMANDMAKLENNIGVMFSGLMVAIREEFEKRGDVEGIWIKDIGFNTEALKEGKFVLSFTDNQALK